MIICCRNLKKYSDLECLEAGKSKGAILRSTAKWAVESDRNTAHYLRLEKSRQGLKTIKKLAKENGETEE